MSWLNTRDGMDLHERLVDRLKRAGLPERQAETAATSVFGLLTNVRIDHEDIETSSLGAPEREFLRARSLAADLSVPLGTVRHTKPWPELP